MIIECPSCHARYQYDEARFDLKASKKTRCARCATVFEIFNPSEPKQEPAPPEPGKAEPTPAPAKKVPAATAPATPEPVRAPKPAAPAAAAPPKAATPRPVAPAPQELPVADAAAAPAQTPAPKSARATSGEQTRARRPKPTIEHDRHVEEPPAPAAELVALAMPEGKRVSLAIINGPNAGSVLRVVKPMVTIGRKGAGADIELDDNESSREHATIEVRDVHFLLRDMGSKNGTLVDGRKIEEPAEIQDKAEFVVGETTLMLIVTQEN